METPLTGEFKPEVRILPNLEVLSREAAAIYLRLSEKCISSKGRFVVALSGGSTPRRFYSLLSEVPYRDQVDWRRVHFFWADERCVPKEDEASNFKLAFDAFLSKVPVPEGNLHRIRGEKEPAEGAEGYEKEIGAFFGREGSPVFDLILLGVGEDGHTASLFPDSNALRETNRLVIPVYLRRPGFDRVTLSLPVLNQADHVLFLVSGRSKAAIVREILGEGAKRKSYPAGLVQPVKGRVTWLIDEEAASELKGAHSPLF